MGESFYFYNDPSISRFFKNPLKIFKKGLDPVNMMQTVVNLMRTMKALAPRSSPAGALHQTLGAASVARMIRTCGGS